MTLEKRIALLAELGHYLQSGGDEALDNVIQLSFQENKWFTEENVRHALKSIAEQFLDAQKLQEWLNTNSWWSSNPNPARDLMPLSKTIGIVMAGNLPLVGFQDWMCVFLMGYRARVKLSDKDKRLLPFLVSKMGEWEHESWACTEFVSDGEFLKGFDAVIATGSNNTARYFEQYFGKYPHIIRKNRNSVAVLNGLESREALMALGRDIFMYFGLGCRNVSKLYVPHGYQFDFLLETLHEYREIVNHDKYKNNFDYNFTLLILNKVPHLNNGCLLLTENASLRARIASVHYEYYDDVAELDEMLAARREEIQCVVGNTQITGFSVIPFGQSQEPGLSDYPDGVDIMQFLASLHGAS